MQDLFHMEEETFSICITLYSSWSCDGVLSALRDWTDVPQGSTLAPLWKWWLGITKRMCGLMSLSDKEILYLLPCPCFFSAPRPPFPSPGYSVRWLWVYVGLRPGFSYQPFLIRDSVEARGLGTQSGNTESEKSRMGVGCLYIHIILRSRFPSATWMDLSHTVALLHLSYVTCTIPASLLCYVFYAFSVLYYLFSIKNLFSIMEFFLNSCVQNHTLTPKSGPCQWTFTHSICVILTMSPQIN